MKTIRAFVRDERADAVVEAALLFPIIILIFAALVVLSLYLPLTANLQRAVQHAATTVSVMQSDTGYSFNPNSMTGSFHYGSLKNVYPSMFKGLKDDEAEIAGKIVERLMDGAIGAKGAAPVVSCKMKNFIIYKEIEVTAVQTVMLPLNFSFIGLGDRITLQRAAKATVQNGDEFVRNIDIAADLIKETGLAEKWMKALDKVVSFFKFDKDS